MAGTSLDTPWDLPPVDRLVEPHVGAAGVPQLELLLDLPLPILGAGVALNDLVCGALATGCFALQLGLPSLRSRALPAELELTACPLGADQLRLLPLLLLLYELEGFDQLLLLLLDEPDQLLLPLLLDEPDQLLLLLLLLLLPELERLVDAEGVGGGGIGLGLLAPPTATGIESFLSHVVHSGSARVLSAARSKPQDTKSAV